ncbi:histidine phosphatase family protein [Methylobacterium indicum]|uniref:histidine phosphatase family protein n=1 Tax=Methylobacterium indicum TaxID=1775910 RepID=UPI002435A922|nr:histidine phosphatase family protein [Methylobacterium indicum]
MQRAAIRIFLIRHGLSEANLDKSVNVHKPDFAVDLSPEGHEQARAAGRALVDYLAASAVAEAAPSAETCADAGTRRRARMLVSPYYRTRQTADRVGEALTAAGIRFDRRECEELREINFGIFDGLTDAEIKAEYPREHAHYEKHKAMSGEIFAPMPMGESRIQVGDRVKQVFGTILRDADPASGRAPILDFVVVAHGVSIRQFRQRWLHKPWEWAEGLKNPANCSIMMIEGRAGLRLGPDGASYAETPVFDGFAHVRKSTQDIREEGRVA